MFDGLLTHVRPTNSPFSQRRVAPFVSMSAISAGLARSEFIAMFQPAVCPETGRVITVEATLTWKHPTRGPLAPFEFLCEADQFGFLDQLANELIDQAAFAGATWRNSFEIDGANGLSSAPIQISLSGARLRTLAASQHIDSYNTVADDHVCRLIIKDFDEAITSRSLDLTHSEATRSSIAALFGLHKNLHEVDAIGVSTLLHWYIATEYKVRSIQGDFICPPVRSEGLVAALSNWHLNFKTLNAASQFSNID